MNPFFLEPISAVNDIEETARFHNSWIIHKIYYPIINLQENYCVVEYKNNIYIKTINDEFDYAKL